MMQTVLAKALYDNIADNEDELTFRKGDVITVLEKDIDGLFGWWLCSLHGRQGIAPGNRLTEIPKETEPLTTPPDLDELDYAVPKPYEEKGEDYDVPRSVFSPQDYDFPKVENKFEYPPEAEKTSRESPSLVDNTVDNIYQEIYDVPTSPVKIKPEPLLIPEKRLPPKRPPSPQKTPSSPTKSPTKTMTKPPRKINVEKNSGLKPAQTPPPRPPKPVSPRTPKPETTPFPAEEVYDVPAVQKLKLSHTNSATVQSNSLSAPASQDKAGICASLESNSMSREKAASGNSIGSPEEIYDVPSSETVGGEELYDVPPSLRTGQEGVPDQEGDIYDIPKFPISSKETVQPDQMNIWEKQKPSGPNSRMSASGSEVGGASRGSEGSSPNKSRPGSDSSDKSGSKAREVGVAKRRSGESGGKRESSSSTGSGKVSSEDDDYVDYQEIYGDIKSKPVNLYDVPVQPVPVADGSGTPPTKKQTKVSILQRINMTAVKGIKLDPSAALQRLTKLEQAVDVTIAKLLSFVTNTWRDPTLLRSNVADIRDIAGKAKVVLRLLTEFGLSTLVNSQKLAQQDLTGLLSRAIEPLLETYYSLKLTLQRLDDSDWKAPLTERKEKQIDDLDMIMAYMQSVPKDSKKLATVIRTAATTLYKLPKEPLPAPPPKKDQAKVKEELTTIANGKPEPSPTQAKKAAEVTSKIERFKPVAMEAESADVESTTMMVGLIKACVDANIKPGDGPKFSPETVRRLCGLSSNSSSSLKDTQRDNRNETAADGASTPKLPPRRSDSNKDSDTSQGPEPPMRKGSGDRVHHVRQRSLERFSPDGSETFSKVPPKPPPKPKLDRKPTFRKSYKYRARDETDEMQRAVKFRERISIPESPKEGKRKCNSDPTELERLAEDGNNNKEKRVSDGMETTVPSNTIASRSNVTSPNHCSDSALPSSPTGQRSVTPLSPKLTEFQGNPRPEFLIKRSKSFTRTKPPAPKATPFTENGMSDIILSFDDKELLEFYKYEIDAQLFVLNEAMKSLFSAIEENKPPKVFVSNSKFVVLSAHKFIYIGETLQSKISHDKLGSDITSVTTKLSDCAKKLVHATKMAALQYSAVTPMREMATAASAVSDAAIELHKVVKLKANS